MRAAARLVVGNLPFQLLPDGRVIAVLPPVRLPFGAAIQATVLYPNLRAFLTVALGRPR